MELQKILLADPRNVSVWVKVATARGAKSETEKIARRVACLAQSQNHFLLSAILFLKVEKRKEARSLLRSVLIGDPANTAAADRLVSLGNLDDIRVALATLRGAAARPKMDLAQVFVRTWMDLQSTEIADRVVRRLVAFFTTAFAEDERMKHARPAIARRIIIGEMSGLLHSNPLAAALVPGDGWEVDRDLLDLARRCLLQKPDDTLFLLRLMNVGLRPNNLTPEERLSLIGVALRGTITHPPDVDRNPDRPLGRPEKSRRYAGLRALVLADQRANQTETLIPALGRVLRDLITVPDAGARARIDGYRAASDGSAVGVYIGDVDSLTAQYFAPGILAGVARAGAKCRVYTRSSLNEIEQSTFHGATRDIGVEFAVLGDASEMEIAERIAADRNRVYLDLRGQSRDHMVSVLAARPSPVTAYMIGHGETSGISGVDAILADAIIVPDSAGVVTENSVIRLSGGLLNMNVDTLPSSPSEFSSRDRPVFGAFHQSSKISTLSLDLWADALNAVPNSDLVIKVSTLEPRDILVWIVLAMQARGIERDRIKLYGRTETREDHFDKFRLVDVILDTSPFNGVTTTLEALWMGVPVIAVAGERMLARYGASILQHAGLPEYCAPDPAHFGRTAARVVADRQALRDFRIGGREALLKTPTFNRNLYADSLAEGVARLL